MDIINFKTRKPIPIATQSIEIITEYCIAKTVITNEYQVQGSHDLYFYFLNNSYHLFGSLEILHKNSIHRAYFKEISYAYDNERPKDYIDALKLEQDEIKMPFAVEGQFKCILILHYQMEIIERKYWYKLQKNFIIEDCDISLNSHQLILNTQQDIHLQIDDAQSVCLRSSDSFLLQYISTDVPIPQTDPNKEYYFLILTDNLFFINNFKTGLDSIKGSYFNVYTYTGKIFPRLMQIQADTMEIATRYPYHVLQQFDAQRIALQNCLADISESDTQYEKRIIVIVDHFLLTHQIIDLMQKQTTNIRIYGIQLSNSQFNMIDALCYLGKGNSYNTEQQDILSSLLKAIHEDKIQQGVFNIQLINEKLQIEQLPHNEQISPVKAEFFRQVFHKYFYSDKQSTQIVFTLGQEKVVLPIVQVENINSIVFKNQKNYLGTSKAIETSIRHQVPFQFTQLSSDLSFAQPEEIIVKISNILKDVYEIYTTPKQTILGLKILISERTEIHPDNIRLIINGRNCSDNQALSEFKIKNGGVVYWVYRLSPFTFQIQDTIGKILFQTIDLKVNLQDIIKQQNYQNPKISYYNTVGQQIYLVKHDLSLESIHKNQIRTLILDEMIQVLVNDERYYVKHYSKYVLQDLFDQIGYSVKGNLLYHNNQLIEQNVTLGELGIKEGLHLRTAISQEMNKLK